MKSFIKPILFLQAIFLSFFSGSQVNVSSSNIEPISITRKEASISESYFSDIEQVASSLSRQQLFSRLQKKVNEGWIRQSYKALGESLADVDFVDNGYMVDIYSNTSRLKVNDTGNYSKEGDSWNKEHLIPKSWWGGNESGPNGEGGDMFNMYPTDGYINGMRSNYPMGETNKPTRTSNNSFSKLGPSSFSGYSGTVFEPNDIWKGNIARSYFYFALKYVTYTSSSYTSGNGGVHFNKNGNFGLTTYSANLFLDWNKHLEKNDYEQERAYRIYSIQNNLNPFSFHPEWADYIWGNIPLTSVEPASISINESSSRIRLGASKQLTCTILPNNADKSVTWSSSDEEIASVNEDGIVSGKKIGSCQIRATSQSNPSLSDVATVEVHNDKVNLVSIKLPSSIELGINETKDINISFVPEDASNKEVEMEIENASIVSISSNKLLGLKEGSTTLKVTSKENKEISASATINVVSDKELVLVTNRFGLVNGNKFVIASKEKGTVATAFEGKILTSGSATFPTNGIENYPSSTSIFTLIDNNDGTYCFGLSNGDYLSSSSAKNLSLNGTNNKWIIDFNGEKVIIANKAYPTYPLLYNVSSPRFRTYEEANATLIYPSIYIEKATASEEANNYITSFMKKTSTYCSKGNIPTSLWKELSEDYLLLSEEATSYIRNNQPELEDFVSRYEFIANKYGYEDFIFEGDANKANIIGVSNADYTYAWIMAILVLLSVSTFLIYRKIKKI